MRRYTGCLDVPVQLRIDSPYSFFVRLRTGLEKCNHGYVLGDTPKLSVGERNRLGLQAHLQLPAKTGIEVFMGKTFFWAFQTDFDIEIIKASPDDQEKQYVCRLFNNSSRERDYYITSRFSDDLNWLNYVNGYAPEKEIDFVEWTKTLKKEYDGNGNRIFHLNFYREVEEKSIEESRNDFDILREKYFVDSCNPKDFF